MVRADASSWPRAQRRHATTADVEAGVVDVASLLVRRRNPCVHVAESWLCAAPVTQRTGGAVLSLDDFGSSVERAAKRHPLWQGMQTQV